MKTLPTSHPLVRSIINQMNVVMTERDEAIIAELVSAANFSHYADTPDPAPPAALRKEQLCYAGCDLGTRDGPIHPPVVPSKEDMLNMGAEPISQQGAVGSISPRYKPVGTYPHDERAIAHGFEFEVNGPKVSPQGVTGTIREGELEHRCQWLEDRLCKADSYVSEQEERFNFVAKDLETLKDVVKLIHRATANTF